MAEVVSLGQGNREEQARHVQKEKGVQVHKSKLFQAYSLQVLIKTKV